MKKIITLTFMFFSIGLLADSNTHSVFKKNYSPIKNHSWSINFSKGAKEYTVWVSKRDQLIVDQTKKNIRWHTKEKSAKNLNEILVVFGLDSTIDVFLDLNITGIRRPITKSSIKVIAKNKIPKTVQCEYEALVFYTESGNKAYFCKHKGELGFVSSKNSKSRQECAITSKSFKGNLPSGFVDVSCVDDKSKDLGDIGPDIIHVMVVATFYEKRMDRKQAGMSLIEKYECDNVDDCKEFHYLLDWGIKSGHPSKYNKNLGKRANSLRVKVSDKLKSLTE